VKNIFVGSLSFRATEEDIRQLFSAYGTVDRVSIPMDRETGRSRGFGFVEMPNDNEADAAIAALNGSSHMGRTLNVNEARPKEGGGGGFERGGGGGGRGRRGGRGGYGDSGGY
jgi:RNA recognition motif-containing protein